MIRVANRDNPNPMIASTLNRFIYRASRHHLPNPIMPIHHRDRAGIDLKRRVRDGFHRARAQACVIPA